MSPPPIGFVLVTHSNPDQVLHLCHRLTSAFSSPPIAIHHDFSQAALDKALFPSNVMFVEETVKTRWGGYGVVEGEFRALRLLYQEANPDWFVLLSGADYPIKPAATILRELESGGYDAYLDTREIVPCKLPIPSGGWGDENFIHPAWVRLAFERYVALGFGFYKIATKLNWKTKALYLRSKFFTKRFTPFDGKVRCYAGDYWITGNRLTAQALLAESDVNRRLMEHFRHRPNPDEAIHQTLLGNTKLSIHSDNKRYTSWTGQINHPKLLSAEDFPAMLASTDHFARKLQYDPASLAKLDAMVDAAG